MQERDSAEKGDQPEEAPTVRGPMPGHPGRAGPRQESCGLGAGREKRLPGSSRTLCSGGSRAGSHTASVGPPGLAGLTHAQYLSALVALHDALRQRADSGDDGAAATLSELGLRTVSI